MDNNVFIRGAASGGDCAAGSGSIDEIVASLPEPDRIIAAQKMAELDRKLEHRRQFDAAVLDSLIRILKTPLGKTLRDKIKEIAANA